MFDALKRKKHANRNRIGFICRILVLFSTALYCTVPHCTTVLCTVLHCTVLYCTVLYCTILYCTYTVRAHSSYLQIPRESESRSDQIRSNQLLSVIRCVRLVLTYTVLHLSFYTVQYSFKSSYTLLYHSAVLKYFLFNLYHTGVLCDLALSLLYCVVLNIVEELFWDVLCRVELYVLSFTVLYCIVLYCVV